MSHQILTRLYKQVEELESLIANKRIAITEIESVGNGHERKVRRAVQEFVLEQEREPSRKKRLKKRATPVGKKTGMDEKIVAAVRSAGVPIGVAEIVTLLKRRKAIPFGKVNHSLVSIGLSHCKRYGKLVQDENKLWSLPPGAPDVP